MIWLIFLANRVNLIEATHTILGEIIDRSAKKLIKSPFLYSYVNDLLSFIIFGLKTNRFTTLPLHQDRDMHCKYLLKNVHIPLDDAFHLSSSIILEMDYIATTDKKIIGSAPTLKNEFGIKVLNLS